MYIYMYLHIYMRTYRALQAYKGIYTFKSGLQGLLGLCSVGALTGARTGILQRSGLELRIV